MHIDVLTLFPSMFAGAFEASIIKRAQDAGIVSIGLHNIRDYARDKHHTVDDTTFGGGDGMVMKPEPIFDAVEALRQPDTHVVLLTPRGRLLDQSTAQRLSEESR